MRTKQVTASEALDTTRIDFLVSVDKLLRVAEETRQFRDKLLQTAKVESKPEVQDHA